MVMAMMVLLVLLVLVVFFFGHHHLCIESAGRVHERGLF